MDGGLSDVNGRHTVIVPHYIVLTTALKLVEQCTHVFMCSLLQSHDKNNMWYKVGEMEHTLQPPTTMGQTIGMHDTHAYHDRLLVYPG